jgi:membrane-anchored protein YejM (alkaline phosphatase superfamily)
MSDLTGNVVSRRTLLKAGVWFSILNSIFVLLLSFRYLSFVSEVLLTANKFYLFSLVFSHFVFLSFIPFFFLYTPLTILTKNKKVSIICAIIGISLLLFLLLIDSYVFTLYRFHINKYVIEQMLGPGASQVFELALVQYLLLALVVALLVVAEVYIFRLAYWLAEKKKILNLYIICGISLFLAIITQFIHAKAKAEGDRTITALDRYFPLCTPLNANEILYTMGVNVEEDVLKTNFDGKIYEYPKAELKSSFTGKNVVIIALDSWHYELMDSVVSPNLYKFSKKSSEFTRHYSGSNGTRTGVFSMFFGLPGVYWNDFRKQEISPVLINKFHEYNYDIKLYPSASLRNPPLDKNVFTTVRNQCDATKEINAWQRDRKLTDNFIAYLKNRHRKASPFFSFLFYDSLHSMILPEGYKGPFNTTWKYPKYEVLGFGMEVDAEEFFNLYKNMLRYVDDLFGEVINEMEAEGLLENTILIVTGDHGQEFDDNRKGYWGHNGNFSDAQVRTPLIYYSSDKAPQVYNHWTAHYDIVPTLMQDVFNVENPTTDYTIGKSLFDKDERSFLSVDSYIALGIIDSVGTITNIYNDGSYEILDNQLNELPEANFDQSLYHEVLKQISSFYEVDKK